MNFYHLIYFYLYYYFNHDFINEHDEGNNIRPSATLGIVCWFYVFSISHYFIRFNRVNSPESSLIILMLISGVAVWLGNYFYFKQKKRYIIIYNKYYKYRKKVFWKLLCLIFLFFPVLLLFPFMIIKFR